jgi:hypothetical protein
VNYAYATKNTTGPKTPGRQKPCEEPERGLGNDLLKAKETAGRTRDPDDMEKGKKRKKQSGTQNFIYLQP